MDGSIPRRALAAVLGTIDELSKTYRLEVMNVFHAGDGNLHPVILLDADDPDQLDRAQRLGSAILTACLEAGGSITGEHGVGVEKLDEMCAQFTTIERERLLATKQAFDLAGLLNPGKGLPTLRRCAEGGALLVHDGKLPHPELERF
jgi:glycolate oxidase